MMLSLSPLISPKLAIGKTVLYLLILYSSYGEIVIQPFCFQPFPQVPGYCVFYLLCVALKSFPEVSGCLK
jgi:hypothetical protein